MDAVAGDYASLGNVEIVNVSRTISYLNNGLKPSTMTVEADCGCPGLFDLIGCPPAVIGYFDPPCPPVTGYVDPSSPPVTGCIDYSCPPVTGYTTPTLDQAPWYSPDHPESGEFAGFYPVEFEGMSSTFTREITESIGDGGILGRGRAGSRTLTWSGYLLGANCCAVAYGLRWLTNTLRASSQCRDCNGDDLELLVCCPGPDSDIEPFRILKNVALLEGPEIISERRTSGQCSGVNGGCGGSVIMEIEFSLVAAQPWFYKAEIPVVNNMSFTNSTTPVSNPAVDCGPVDCRTITGCTTAVLPPAGSYAPCLVQPVATEALYITVPRSTWDEFDEVIPYITISTEVDIQWLTLGIYSSTSDDPCGQLLLNPPLCDVICDELSILQIPAFSKFIIDGRTQKMSLICPGNFALAGEPLTQGPWSWPIFTCYGVCIEVRHHGNPASSLVDFPNSSVNISLSLVPREL